MPKKILNDDRRNPAVKRLCPGATEMARICQAFLGSYKGMYRSEDIQGLFILPNPKKKGK